MFTLHTKETAPAESHKLLEQSAKNYGFTPNFHRIMAEAPATYDIYEHAFHQFLTNTTFSKLEAQLIFMTANYYNNCSYCMAGHSWGMTMARMPEDVINDLRDGSPIADAKLEELRSFTLELLKNHGNVSEERINQFLEAGYTKRQILEIVGGLSAKLISSMVNALAKTEVDDSFAAHSWTKPE